MNAALVVGAVLALVVTPASVSAAPTAAELEVLVGRHGAGDRRSTCCCCGGIFVPLERLTAHDAPRRPARSRAAACVIRKPDGRGRRAGQAPSTTCSTASRPSARAAPAARSPLSEGERLRVARELHDQVGQTLTGVVLALEEIHRRAPADLAGGHRGGPGGGARRCRAGARDRARAAAGRAGGARPAQRADDARPTASPACACATRSHRDLPVLSPDQDLAVYRVAQESADQRRAPRPRAARRSSTLEEEDGAVVLRVSDDGCGIPRAARRARPTAASAGCASARCSPAGGCACARCPSAAPK